MAERRRPPVSVVTTSPTLHSDYTAGLPSKGTRLSVTVVEALRDLIVVSLDHNSKVYQGALLDITNRSIKPFCSSPFPKPEDSAEDEAMFALKMRHTYMVSSRENEAPFNGGIAGQGTGKAIEPARDKRAPRTKIDQHVRMRKLRPRQTLCSNCQSRCEDASTGATTTTSRGSAKKNTAPLVSVVRGTRESHRAPPLEAPQGSGGKSGGEPPHPSVPTQTSPSPWTEETPPQADVYGSVAEDPLIKEELPSSAQMPESEEPARRQQQRPLLPPDHDRREREREREQITTAAQPVMTSRKKRSSLITLTSKAGDERRTTRAEVKAQQQQQIQTEHHHLALPQQSPVIKISFNNPQGKGTIVKIPAKVAVADYEETTSDDEEKEDFAAVPEAGSVTGPYAGISQETERSAGGKPKRRKRETTAEAIGENMENQPAAVQTSVRHHKHKAGKHKRKRHKESGGTENTGDSDGESVPNFPQAAVGGGETNNGEEFAVAAADEPLRNGDVVWGKVMGFPWWPGRILSIGAEDETSSANDSDMALLNGEAHVAWFGSSTSSRILTSSLAPFLRDFKLRYNRRKRGPYKEAIRQATQEAKAKTRTG
ncbi:PWWP domain-containing protein 2A-like [Varroa jacobsoni]|uniref:PWWP domain-containing protein n=1 Tax=Varroa destructor TaxID=109461 RepID=A0A7M7KCY0_VARDE|nr:PWWP domain-containing protein 2A-like isoform X2 [Varroa destructor]XP_022687302.1 PWWP domain-containing protein 2A-like [Varroa jacobsoni]